MHGPVSSATQSIELFALSFLGIVGMIAVLSGAFVGPLLTDGDSDNLAERRRFVYWDPSFDAEGSGRACGSCRERKFEFLRQIDYY